MTTTTTFRIVLMFLSMGTNELMSHRKTPATMRAITIESSDMITPFGQGFYNFIRRGHAPSNLLGVLDLIFPYFLELMMFRFASSAITRLTIPRCTSVTEAGSGVLLVALQIILPPLPVVVTSMARIATDCESTYPG